MYAFFATTLFAAAVRGHMIMAKPVPYDTPAVSHSPIDSSNFPCQLTAGQSLVSGSASNAFALGSEQELAFIGQAVHGGGSCQVSITYDKNPSATSTWKVIRSIEGGCPAQGQTGNMGDDANAVDPYTYNFTIPDNIPAGDVTLAWTWFNKIGNREMYMNCAPVTLTGTSTGSEADYESLPDMFVANIDNGCSTTEGGDLLFPNPGSDVIQMNIGTTSFLPPVGTCQTAVSAAGTISATTAAAAATSTGGYGGVFITVSTSSSAAAAAATTAAAETTTTSSPAAVTTVAATTFVTATTGTTTTFSVDSAATAAFATTAGSSGSGSSSDSTSGSGSTSNSGSTSSSGSTSNSGSTSSSGSTSGSGSSGSNSGSGSSGSTSSSSSGSAETAGSACSPEGTWNCLGSSYQQCASGVWSVVQEMAAGTSCTVGTSTAMSVNANTKRDRRNAARAAARMASHMAPRVPRRQ